MALRVFDTGPAPDCDHADSDYSSSEDDTDAEEKNVDSVILKGFLEKLQTGKIDGLYIPNGQQHLSRLGKQHMPDLCGACEKMLKGRLQQESRAMFKRLPKLFGIRIDGWGQKLP